GLTLISGISGWMQITVRFFGVAWVQVLHTWSSYALLALAGVHVLGVAVVSIMQRQNLVVAMFTGKKKRRSLGRAYRSDKALHSPKDA
ncbi:MAG: cytochrome B, partial [Bradyrhizobiaceae bacterium]